MLSEQIYLHTVENQVHSWLFPLYALCFRTYHVAFFLSASAPPFSPCSFQYLHSATKPCRPIYADVASHTWAHFRQSRLPDETLGETDGGGGRWRKERTQGRRRGLAKGRWEPGGEKQ